MMLPNTEQIEQSMRFFVPADRLGEVRIIRPNGGTSGFFFRHEEISEAAALAAELDPQSKGVYLVMNEIDPAILDGRDTLTVLFGGLTKDENITRRRKLLIDCDPKSAERGATDSATDDEKAPSFEVRETIFQSLGELGFPEPAFCDSGNGAHLLYGIDLPNDDETKTLIQTFLNVLAKRFSTDQVGVDISVHNASRITKLYGTVARKGENRPDRPHRLSSIQSLPDGEIGIATRELIATAIKILSAEPTSLLEQQYDSEHEPTGLIGNLQDFTPTKPKLILPATFAQGEKHYNMLALAGAMRSIGANETEIYQTLLVFKQTRCTQDFDNAGIAKIARDYGTKDVNLSMKALMECDSEEKIEAAQRQQNLKLALEQASKRVSVGHDTTEVILKLRTVIEAFSACEQPQTFKTMTSAELDAADLQTDYLVSDALAARQPGVLAGVKKVLKTGIAIDLTASLASGDRFIGKFYVPRPRRVALMSGESGDATIQETARRICRSKQWKNLGDYENAVWSFDLPRLGQPQTKRDLIKFIHDYALEVLIIDPAYLCLDVGDGAGNVFSMGPKLYDLTEIGHETGCTIIIVHHCRKKSTDPFAVPELEDIAWSGFQEWARQWILIGRREAYNPENAGSHRLWLNVGGSAGHSGLWGVDIEEGSRSDQGGRRWEVSIDGASKIIAENISEHESAKEQQAQAKAHRQLAADAEKLLKQYRKYPQGDTLKCIRERASVNGVRGPAANTKLLDNGLIEECQITKNGRSYDGFRAVSVPVGLTGSDRVFSGSGPGCPDDEHRGGPAPLIGGGPCPAHRDVSDSLFAVADGTEPGDPVTGGRPA